MAENFLWSWVSPDASPSSHSSHEAMRNFDIPTPPQLDGVEFLQGAAEAQLFLMETLETCLAYSPTATEPTTTSPGRSVADPMRSAPATTTSPPHQSRHSSGFSSGGADALSPKRNPSKRRSRASRRLPTMTVEATCSDFRETVHRLTGIDPKPQPRSPAPVRPRPKRASPATIARPVPHFPSNSTLMHSSPVASIQPAFWNQLRSDQVPEHIHSESFVTLPCGSTTSSQAETTPMAMPWWDARGNERSRTDSCLTEPSSEAQSFQDDPGFSIEDWFQQTKHSSSGYMH